MHWCGSSCRVVERCSLCGLWCGQDAQLCAFRLHRLRRGLCEQGQQVCRVSSRLGVQCRQVHVRQVHFEGRGCQPVQQQWRRVRGMCSRQTAFDQPLRLRELHGRWCCRHVSQWCGMHGLWRRHHAQLCAIRLHQLRCRLCEQGRQMPGVSSRRRAVCRQGHVHPMRGKGQQ